ncbi:MAG: hypothetical protein QOD56_1158 [Gammaproteobacteria bacterium]|nr:hypothetical protein [Gammaproteobacteria bacterium]
MCTLSCRCTAFLTGRPRTSGLRRCVEKVFLTDGQSFLEPLVPCSCSDVRATSFHTKTTIDRGIGLTERCSGGHHKNRHSRDFPGCSIFDFCNSIRQKRKLLRVSFDPSTKVWPGATLSVTTRVHYAARASGSRTGLKGRGPTTMPPSCVGSSLHYLAFSTASGRSDRTPDL